MADILERLSGALANRYVIERELGAGGMATVYLAQDLKHRRKVALKVLRPELAASLGPDRFAREIEIAAQLTHPHILPLFDSGDADGLLYYVMPYVDGESLRSRLDQKGKLTLEDSVRLADQVAAALSYAHEQGVVHRDIKPENILLAGDQAIVADFGIARAVAAAGGERLTATGLAIGTPAYMSPEQALGMDHVDGRSDVYALGCVMYEAVSGRAPFAGSTPQELVAKHAADTVPALRAEDPAIPLFVERAVAKALAKQPEDRFQTPSGFAEALTAGTVVARVGGARWLRRMPLAVAGMALVALAVWWLTLARAPTIRRLAVLPATNLTDAAAQEHIVQGLHHALITELGQAGVTVIGGLQSMLRYQQTTKTVRDIAQELGVDAVIEFSVFWGGDSVGIDARLIDGRTEEALWSHSYDEETRNVRALVRWVTRAIAKEIHLTLTPQAEAALARVQPVDPEAHEAYLKGQLHAGKLTQADLELAIDYFELALEKDPESAAAYAGIAWVWVARSQMALEPHEVAAPRARAAALRAVELDSMLAEAQHAVGTAIGWLEWNWDLMETSLRRALVLNPSYADARADYSHLLLVLGRTEEAMAQIDSALVLDPYSVKLQAFRGIVLLNGPRRYDEAITQFRTVLRTVPNHPVGFRGLYQAFHALGRYDEALAQFTALHRARGDHELEDALARGYAEAGYSGALRAAAAMLVARRRTTFVAPVALATLYGLAGLRDETLDWIEEGFRTHEPNMPYVGVTPLNDFVRQEPRFQDLLRRMNLPSN